MLMFWFSAVLVIGANGAYHVCQKAIPSQANPTVSVFVTFSTAALASFLLALFWVGGGSVSGEIQKLNWTSVALGLTIVGVDIGYLLLYRAGWNVSLGSVFCNAWVALLLIPIGIVLFKEKLVPANYAGIALVIAGLFLIVRR
jgi:drug/metabolite transporter (DMT)-like permease